MKTERAIKAAKAKAAPKVPKGVAPTLAPGYRSGYAAGHKAGQGVVRELEARTTKAEKRVAALELQLKAVRKAVKA